MQALPIAAAGLLDAAGRFDASARRMATEPLDNLVQEAVAQQQAKADFQANAAVIRATDEMMGTLLDITA